MLRLDEWMVSWLFVEHDLMNAGRDFIGVPRGPGGRKTIIILQDACVGVRMTVHWSFRASIPDELRRLDIVARAGHLEEAAEGVLLAM